MRLLCVACLRMCVRVCMFGRVGVAAQRRATTVLTVVCCVWRCWRRRPCVYLLFLRGALVGVIAAGRRRDAGATVRAGIAVCK